jgi:hypothetical protein
MAEGMAMHDDSRLRAHVNIRRLPYQTKRSLEVGDRNHVLCIA